MPRKNSSAADLGIVAEARDDAGRKARMTRNAVPAPPRLQFLQSGRIRPTAAAAALALMLFAAAAIALLLSWRPAIAPTPAPPRSAFSEQTIARGAQLAAIGNCAGCHTADGGIPYAGGTPLTTPFGTIHGTNITPDAQTGIGGWPFAAFVRAMRDGVARDGSHLYPAFPYDHFRHTHDDDLQALYAFVMTRDPVVARAPHNALMFPLQFRPLLAGWKLLFLRSEPVPDGLPAYGTADATDRIARGAYLVRSLAHCGACHTPRNALGAERRGAAFAGGQADGWYAPPLNADNPSPQRWTLASLSEYLRTGISARHAMAGGPMQPVSAALAYADASDVEAIAAAVLAMIEGDGRSFDGQGHGHGHRQERGQGQQRLQQREARAVESARRASAPLPAPASPAASSAQEAQWVLGASVYASACAGCHDQGRRPGSSGALQMPLAVAVYDADPASLLRIIRQGIFPVDGSSGRWMPAFGDSLTDAQITALAAYLRRSAAEQPPWPDLPRAVADSARSHGISAGR